jgi:TonB-dependent receptor-like protein
MRTFCISKLGLSLTLIIALAQFLHSQSPQRALEIAVLDENSVPVPAARVLLQGQAQSMRCVTDLVGRCHFTNLSLSAWQLRVEKEGFYVFALPAVQTSGTLEVILTRQKEVREAVDVVESSPAIDPSQVSSQEQLSGLDIINIPYPNTRDYRYALNFIPGIVLDPSAQPHLAGGETHQTLVLLDGFNVTQPANGQLLVRVSTDALRTVNVETSRLPAQDGKGPAGVLGLETGIGDDHFRFAATNFFPSFQNKKGWALDKVDPRFTISGPIEKGRIWFFDGLDGEYDNVIIPELLPGEDTDTVWRLGNLAKLQANVTSRDIVTTSLLINRLHDDHFKFSTLAPALTTPEDSENVYVAAIKEQHSFSGEKLLELGFAFDQYGLRQVPAGTAAYVLTPEGAQGNYYLHEQTNARRWQTIMNFYAPRRWHGRHDLMFGADLDRLSYHQFFQRSSISSLNEDRSLALLSVFFGGGPSTTYNTEASAYLQDRWSLMPRLLIEPGVRFDWDEIIRRSLYSPRLAGTYVLDNSGDTKISAGVGVVYQSTNLFLIAAPLAGSRNDTFYNLGNNPVSFLTTFAIDRNRLEAPRFLNWSLALERKLPAQIFVKAEFLQRNGTHGFVFNTPGGFGGINFQLQNTRQDRYYSFKADFRRTFQKRFIVTASYTHSRSHSNQVFDYSLDNLIFSPQVPGPYPWDAPNRFISWGLLPLVKGFDVGYSLEARTGFPFAVINDQQQLVEPPGDHRFPRYFTLNLHLEKRFHALGFYWALRGGFDNITNHQNPFVVNNDINSPQFLQFSAFDRRAFTARIRFLGRK